MNMNSKASSFFSILQRVGQSLMVPVSVLPAAGLLVALGRMLEGTAIGSVLYSGGLAIFEQLPMVFAIGVAIGFTGGAGVSGLAAAVGYFTLTNVLKTMGEVEKLPVAINTGVFGGIIIGLVVAALYNRFHQTKLHPVLGFFSGKRLVPILSAGAAFVVGLLLAVLWPPIQNFITSAGESVVTSSLGPAFYAAGKRLLIPVGLHHVFYPPFLYQFGDFTTAAGQVVHGEAARYFAGDKSAGLFMAAEYPLMLFGLPAAALAMVLAAKPTRRKAIAGVMLSAALTSIITGITEPIEFAFIFVAPLLYFLHVALAFLSGLLTASFDIHLGYTFSASLIDFGLGFFNQKNGQLLFIVVGPLMALLYGSSFYFLIKKFNFATPGRDETAGENGETASDSQPARSAGVGSSVRPALILEALGGKKNIKALDACITRLRLSVNKPDLVKKERLKELGASGTLQTGNNIQVIFGVESDHLKEEIKELMVRPRLYSPMTGKLIPLSEIPDATFAEKILGDGFAIVPTEGKLFAPVGGQIMQLFRTNHALGLKTEDGLELLIHIGIDTVKMNGEGFTAHIKEGDIVRAGDLLMSFDYNLAKAKAKSLATPVIITNMDLVDKISVIATGDLKPQQAVIMIALKK
jgi:glucose-specific phosphotransferase system IIA component